MRHFKTKIGTYRLEYTTNFPVEGLITYAPTIKIARNLAKIAMRNDDVRGVCILKVVEVFRRD